MHNSHKSEYNGSVFLDKNVPTVSVGNGKWLRPLSASSSPAQPSTTPSLRVGGRCWKQRIPTLWLSQEIENNEEEVLRPVPGLGGERRSSRVLR